jgi:hypothetical protein
MRRLLVIGCAAALLGLGVWRTSVGSVAHATTRYAARPGVTLTSSLKSEVQELAKRFLQQAKAPRALLQRRIAPGVGGSICPVSGDRQCSLTPCIEFVAGGSRPQSSVAGAVLLTGLQGVAVAAPQLSSPAPGTSCSPTKSGPPHTLRVWTAAIGGSARTAPASYP